MTGIPVSNQRTVSLTNILLHSNFDATTNWTAYNTSFAVASNEFTSTATAQYGYVLQNFSIVTGRTYYFATSLYAGANTAFIALSDTVTTVYGVHSSTTGYERLSRTIVSAATTSGGAAYAFLETATSGFQQVRGKYAVLIDLTSAWGASKQPTKAQMDWLMLQFTNQWFSGTTTAVYDW